jgi:hypothetical protein
MYPSTGRLKLISDGIKGASGGWGGGDCNGKLRLFPVFSLPTN